MKSFDWLGFDLDHTVIRYKIGPLDEMIFNNCIDYLIKDVKYEAELFEVKSEK